MKHLDLNHLFQEFGQATVSVLTNPRTTQGSAIGTAAFSVASIFEQIQPLIAVVGTGIGICISISLFYYQRRKHINEERLAVAELELKNLEIQKLKQQISDN